MRVFKGLRAAGIGVQVHYVPVDHFSLFRSSSKEPTPNVESYYAGAISLPMFPGMEAADIGRVVGELRGLLSAGAAR